MKSHMEREVKMGKMTEAIRRVERSGKKTAQKEKLMGQGKRRNILTSKCISSSCIAMVISDNLSYIDLCSLLRFKIQLTKYFDHPL